VSSKYDASPSTKSFSQLPPEAQTVIASVSFQYGDLATRTPTFWGHVTNERWQKAVDELRNFGDRYPTRRGKEADLLQGAIDRGAFD
jgi:GH24 family phage-related lysozyme (muramidase)